VFLSFGLVSVAVAGFLARLEDLRVGRRHGVVLGAGGEVECVGGADRDAAVPVVCVGDGDREPVQGGRPAMADVLGALLVRVAAGDGGGAGVRVDPALLDHQAGRGRVARAAAVPRGDHPVREVRAPACLRRHGRLPGQSLQALRLAAQVAGLHQPRHARQRGHLRASPRPRSLREVRRFGPLRVRKQPRPRPESQNRVDLHFLRNGTSAWNQTLFPNCS
jgi:hypothetical protein